MQIGGIKMKLSELQQGFPQVLRKWEGGGGGGGLSQDMGKHGGLKTAFLNSK